MRLLSYGAKLIKRFEIIRHILFFINLTSYNYYITQDHLQSLYHNNHMTKQTTPHFLKSDFNRKKNEILSTKNIAYPTFFITFAS